MTSSIRLRFTQRANRDIDDILQYTLDQWGLAQMRAYEQALFDAFEKLRRFPETGRVHEDGLREFVLRHHVILYRFDADTITVLRVMHQRRLRDR